MFYRRRSVFCRLWLNSKIFTYIAWPMPTMPPMPKFYGPMPLTPKFQPMPSTSPTPKFYGPTLPMPPMPKFDPCHPYTHTPMLLMPPMRFSRLFSIYYAILITSFTFIKKLNKTAKTLSNILLASFSNLSQC